MTHEESEKLYAENAGLAMAALRRYFPDLVDDEDMLQLARIGLWKACIAYDETKGTLATLAYRCSRNEILSALRDKDPDTISLSTPINESEDFTDGLTLEDIVPGQEDEGWRDVTKFMNSLTDRQKEILKARNDGMTIPHIAERLNTSVTTIRMELKRIHYAAEEVL